MSSINGLSFADFGSLLAGNIVTAAGTPPTVDQIAQDVVSPYPDENLNMAGSPTNVPICARGNAATARTGINAANKKVAHVCNFPDWANYAVYKAGFYGGQLIQGIRAGIKALLKALGISPTASGIAAEIKAIAKEIKNALSLLQEINKFITGFIKFAALIGKLISYLLTFPKSLLAFFADCIKQAWSALKSGYLDAMSASGDDPTSSGLSDVTSSIQEVYKSSVAVVQEALKTTALVASAPAAAAGAVISNATSGKTPSAAEMNTLTSTLSNTYYGDYKQGSFERA